MLVLLVLEQDQRPVLPRRDIASHLPAVRHELLDGQRGLLGRQWASEQWRGQGCAEKNAYNRSEWLHGRRLHGSAMIGTRSPLPVRRRSAAVPALIPASRSTDS